MEGLLLKSASITVLVYNRLLLVCKKNIFQRLVKQERRKILQLDNKMFDSNACTILRSGILRENRLAQMTKRLQKNLQLVESGGAKGKFGPYNKRF